MRTFRLLLADDNPVFLCLLTRYLDELPGFEVVATASSGEEAIKLTHQQYPDLVVLDLDMPGLNGIQATRLITAAPNAPAVILLTLHDDQEYRRAAREAGALGFVTKTMLREKLVPCMLSSLEAAGLLTHVSSEIKTAEINCPYESR